MTKRIVIAAAAFSLLELQTAYASPVIYSQPPTAPPSTQSSYTSEYDDFTGLIPFRVFDNFTLAANVLIDAVSWQGAYIQGTPGAGPGLQDATSFEVAFYADAAGLPGAQLYSTSVGLANETFVETDVYFGNNAPVFNYSAAIPAFAAAAGTQYWLSVIAHTPNFFPPAPNVWAWTNDDLSNGDDSSYQSSLGGAPYAVGQDRSFSLEGVVTRTPVPEPASLLLVGAGLAGVARRARRRQRR